MPKTGSLLGLSLCILGLSAPADAPQAQETGLLWEIRNPKTSQKSYLFGTMHVFSEELHALTEPLESILDSCDAAVFEIDFDLQTPEHSVQLMQASEPLEDCLNAACYRRLLKVYGTQLDMPEEVIKNLSPLAILFLPYIRFIPEFSEQGMDAYYFELAKSLNKRVIALETIEEQLKLTMRMQYDQQTLSSLCKLLSEKDPIATMMADFQKMLALYLSQDIGQLLRLSQDQVGPGAMQEALIYERNALMLDRLREPLLGESSMLIFVGAAHLAGEQGLLELLRRQGFEVVPKKL